MPHIIYIKYKIWVQRIGARAYTNKSKNGEGGGACKALHLKKEVLTIKSEKEDWRTLSTNTFRMENCLKTRRKQSR